MLFLLQKYLVKYKSLLIFAPLKTETFEGEMAEWSIAAVLKTVDCNRSGGSNPSFSATSLDKTFYSEGFFVL